MKVLKKNIVKAIAAALALCVAGAAIYVNINNSPKIIEHKMPDYFELTDYSSIGFDGEYFIKLAFLSSSEEFLGYTDIYDVDDVAVSDAEPDEPDNSENQDNTEKEPTASDSNDGSEDDTTKDDSEPDNENNADTTYPAENDINLFEINEFDMLMKYNGTDETVVIPESVKEIAGHAFEGNEYVRRIVLHTTIESLLIDAFIGCPNLNEIYYEGSYDEWESVYKAPEVLPYGVEVVIAQESDNSEETTAETTAPVEETAEGTTAETTAPVEETSEDTTAETTAPTEETGEDTTVETTVPIEETTEDTTFETTVPVDESTEDTTAETTASAEETTEDTTAETTAPIDETTEDTTAETTAPVDIV